MGGRGDILVKQSKCTDMRGIWKRTDLVKKTLKETIQEHDENYRYLLEKRPVIHLVPKDPPNRPTVNEMLNILRGFKFFSHL